MKEKDIPQDNSQTYAGHKKVIYAQGEGGQYKATNSTGWDVEEYATLQAVEEFKKKSQISYQQVKEGLASPLLFYMYQSRLELSELAKIAGVFQWQLKRHLKPKVFNALPDKTLKKYTQALGISLSQIKTLPDDASTLDNIIK